MDCQLSAQLHYDSNNALGSASGILSFVETIPEGFVEEEVDPDRPHWIPSEASPSQYHVVHGYELTAQSRERLESMAEPSLKRFTVHDKLRGTGIGILSTNGSMLIESPDLVLHGSYSTQKETSAANPKRQSLVFSQHSACDGREHGRTLRQAQQHFDILQTLNHRLKLEAPEDQMSMWKEWDDTLFNKVLFERLDKPARCPLYTSNSVAPVLVC